MTVRHVATHTQQAPIRIDRDLKIPELVALHRGGGEMFAPVLNPFDRASQRRGDGYYDFFLIEDEFRAKTAANIGRDNANAVFRQLQTRPGWIARGAPSGSPTIRSAVRVVTRRAQNAPAFNRGSSPYADGGFPMRIKRHRYRRRTE